MDESTTGVDASNAGVAEPTLPDGSDIQTADEQRDAATSGGDTQDEADHKDDGGEDKKPSKSEDDGLARFAKSQGIENLDELTERERKLLKSAHDSQKDFHKKRQEEKDALRDTVTDLVDPAQAASEDDSDIVREQKQLKAEMAQLRQYQRVNEFWRQNPDARDLEDDMVRLVNEEREKYGPDAALYLSRDLNRLYKLAQIDRQDPEKLREAGRREEREELRRKQEASADSGSASTSTGRSTGKVTPDWIDNEYDPSNAEHRKMLDSYLSGR